MGRGGKGGECEKDHYPLMSYVCDSVCTEEEKNGQNEIKSARSAATNEILFKLDMCVYGKEVAAAGKTGPDRITQERGRGKREYQCSCQSYFISGLTFSYSFSNRAKNKISECTLSLERVTDWGWRAFNSTPTFGHL